MSFNALNINKSADIQSAFLGSAIEAAVNNANQTDGFIALPPKPTNYHVGSFADLEQIERNQKRAEQLEHGRHVLSLAEGSEATKDYRLVKKCKSPTRQDREDARRLALKRQQAQLQFNANSKAVVDNHKEWLKLPPKQQKHKVRKENQTLNAGFVMGSRTITQELPASVQHTAIGPVKWWGKTVNKTVLDLINPQTGEVYKPKIGQRSAVARIYGRDWSDSYRIRVESQVSSSEPPPQQEGDRETSQLSQKGASKILDSGAYVSAVRGGYTTFLTLTFDNDAQQRIVNEESTIGKEVSRFFDAISKMYQRGWQCASEMLRHENGFDCIGASEAVPANGDSLDYLWVAEMPESEGRGANPHCHVLLRWNVEPHLFHDWAARIESLWGLGFAKLERIRSADAASGYLLKALGYVVKGESSEQGQFKGNRYNISRAARAPAWECLAEFDAQNMFAIINEVKEKWRRKDKPVQSVINKAKGDLVQYQKAYNIQKAKKGRTQAQRNHTLGKMQKRLAEFEQTIKDGYQQLKGRGARANDYQITFDGFDRLTQFFGWAASTRLWGAEMLSGYLRDYSQERAGWGELAKGARNYWKGAGDNQEHQESLWPNRLNQPINDDFEGVTTDEFYNEYSNWEQVAV